MRLGPEKVTLTRNVRLGPEKMVILKLEKARLKRICEMPESMRLA